MSPDHQPAEILKSLRSQAASLRSGTMRAVVPPDLERFFSRASISLAGPLFLELAAEGAGRGAVRQLIERLGALIPPAVVPEAPCDHLDAFIRENDALQLRIDRCRRAMHELPASETAFDQARSALAELAEVDKHYRRQEFLLFARLERHGIVRPGRILWAAHDEIRQWLKYLALQFDTGRIDARKLSDLSDSVVLPLLDDIEWTVFLENRVLLPMARETLDAADWEVVGRHSLEIGWCLVEPPPGCRTGPQPARERVPAGTEAVRLPTGVLTLQVLAGIHALLPMDITYIDTDDRVAYFSAGTRPVFYRSEAILGRDVRCCHPPRSVHYVDQILSDFKAGRETSAQFWKYVGERFVHIRFVALRRADGEYLGTLEIAQDITPLRALEGEQLQLRYDRIAPSQGT